MIQVEEVLLQKARPQNMSPPSPGNTPGRGVAGRGLWGWSLMCTSTDLDSVNTSVSPCSRQLPSERRAKASEWDHHPALFIKLALDRGLHMRYLLRTHNSTVGKILSHVSDEGTKARGLQALWLLRDRV